MFRRILIGAASAAAVYAVTVALAASLGGLTPANLGADGGAVASCDTDGVSADYSVTFDDGLGAYAVDTVTVSGIADACDGQTLHVTLADSSGNALVSETASIPSDAATSVDVSLPSVQDAGPVENVGAAIK